VVSKSAVFVTIVKVQSKFMLLSIRTLIVNKLPYESVNFKCLNNSCLQDLSDYPKIKVSEFNSITKQLPSIQIKLMLSVEL